MECVVSRETSDYIMLDLNGAMDAKGIGAIEDTVLGYATKATRHLLLDLADVTYLSSIGLRLFLQAAKSLARQQRQLLLAAPSEMVRKVLNDAAVDKLITVAPDLKTATHMLQAP